LTTLTTVSLLVVNENRTDDRSGISIYKMGFSMEMVSTVLILNLCIT